MSPLAASTCRSRHEAERRGNHPTPHNEVRYSSPSERFEGTSMRRQKRTSCVAGATVLVCLVLFLSGASPQNVAPRVHLTPVAELPGFRLPQGDPWAPDQARLAVVDQEGLAIWSAVQPTAKSKPVLDALVDEVHWSPDGTWLCCRVRVMNATKGGAVRLQFVPATGGAAEYRIVNVPIGSYVWADDGFVYLWHGQTGARLRVPPPRAWLDSKQSLPAHPLPELVMVAGGTKMRRQRPTLFMPATATRPTQEQLIDSLFTMQSVQPWCRFLDPRSKQLRWVVTLGKAKQSVTCSVDSTGCKRAGLGGSGAASSQAALWATVSPDAQWVIGLYRPNTASAGADRSKPQIRMYSTDGSGPFAVPTLDAQAAAFAHSDPLLAYADSTRSVRVARFDVEVPGHRR